MGNAGDLIPRGGFWNVPCPWWSQMSERSHNMDKEGSRAELGLTHETPFNLPTTLDYDKVPCVHFILLIPSHSHFPLMRFANTPHKLKSPLSHSLLTRLSLGVCSSHHLSCNWGCLSLPHLLQSSTEFLALYSCRCYLQILRFSF